MFDLVTTIISVIVAGLSCAVLIIATHLILWQRHWRLARFQAYVVGTAEIGLVLTVWGLSMGFPEAVIGFWGIAGMAGAADAVAWWIRRRLGYLVDDVTDRAFLRGQIVGFQSDIPEGAANATDATG